MGRIAKYTRRFFMVSAVAVAGGAAFGVWQARRDLPNPLRPSENDVVMNPWLIIDDAGVSIVTPRAEMGQGNHTTLAALVAEELDVAWDQVRVLHGPPAQVYYNGALMKAATGPVWKRSAWQETLGDAMDVVAKTLGLQVTGGSTALADGFVKMRMAGASAREALKAAAAQRLGVAVDRLSTEDGHVIAPDGTRIPYGDLAQAAALLDPPRPALRDPSQWRFLGKSMPRVDMLAKATGTAEFAIDVRLPGMKFATVRRNPHLGAAMVSHDPAPALAVPGVERVIALADGVAVVANTTWAALRGAEAVVVDWAQASYPASSAEQSDRLRAAFDGEPGVTARDDGKAGEVPMGAQVVEATYEVPYLAHATMEPMSAAALFDAGKLTLWAGAQAPGFAASKAASAIGIKTEDVTLHTTLLGGGFGRRAETDFSTIAAQVAAQMPGVPVSVTWSREEDMTHDMYRPAAMARARGWVANGRAEGFDVQTSAPNVTAQAMQRMVGMGGGPDHSVVEGVGDQPYGIPNTRVRGYSADLTVPIGFWRAVGNSQNAFFNESFMDELAHAAGTDPVAFRLQHMAHEGSANVLRAVAEMAGWDTPKRPGTGRGVAFCHSFGTAAAQVIEVEDRGGRIALTRAFIACDPGIALDPAIIEAQMVGGMIFGLSAAMLGEITFDQGRVVQQNFGDYDSLRITAMPEFSVKIMGSGGHVGGVGEPGTPPAAPALANAVFDLTGQRIRTLPMMHAVDFAL